MKKLMIAAAVASAALFANAANILWGDSEVCDLNGDAVGANEVTQYAFYFGTDDAAYTFMVDYAEANGIDKAMTYMYENYKDGTLTINDIGYTVQDAAGVKTDKNGSVFSSSTQAGAQNTENYFASIFEYDTDLDGKADYYMANVGEYKLGTKDKDIDGMATDWALDDGGMTWQSVPEPTSGLLLLLGVAGLALKRRRA